MVPGVRTGRYSSLEGNLEYRTQQGSTVTLPDEVARFNQSGNTTIVFVEYGNMDCLLSGEKCRFEPTGYYLVPRHLLSSALCYSHSIRRRLFAKLSYDRTRDSDKDDNWCECTHIKGNCSPLTWDFKLK